MKKMWHAGRTAAALALILALAAACALAEDERDTTTPRKGIAVAAPQERTGTVPMYERDDENSAVLMAYYSGALLEVINLTDTGMAHVQCGEKGASVMGYMRCEDLRYGPWAMREVPRQVMLITLEEEAIVRNYPDDQAIELWRFDAGYPFYTIGRSGGEWAQLYVEPQRFNYTPAEWGSEYRNGFVRLPEGAATGEFATSWIGDRTLPVEGELSYEEAYARAVDYVLENLDKITRDFPDGLTREEVEAMNCQWWLWLGDGEDPSADGWEVCFFDPEECERDISVSMESDGTLKSVGPCNG